MNENAIKSEIEKGIKQVDDTLTITDFACNIDKEKRQLNVFFTARNANGESVEIKNTWG